MPRFDRNRCKINKLFTVGLVLYMNSLFVDATLAIALGFYFPRGNIFLSELIPYRFYSFIPTGFILGLFQAKIIYATCFNIGLTASLPVVYFFYTSVIIMEELKLGKPKYDTTHSFREIENIQVIYRSLYILNTVITNLIGELLIFMNTTMMLLPIYASYALITNWTEMAFITKCVLAVFGCVAFVIWFLVLQLGKFLQMNGFKLMTSWKTSEWETCKERREMSKFRRSCQLLLLRYKSIFVVRRHTQFVYIRKVSKGVFKALLTAG